jgi:hypothetical protein
MAADTGIGCQWEVLATPTARISGAGMNKLRVTSMTSMYSKDKQSRIAALSPISRSTGSARRKSSDKHNKLKKKAVTNILSHRHDIRSRLQILNFWFQHQHFFPHESWGMLSHQISSLSLALLALLTLLFSPPRVYMDLNAIPHKKKMPLNS